MTSSFRADDQEIGCPNYESSEDGSLLSQEEYTCRRCPDVFFEDGPDFWKHIHQHVESPTVVLHRLTDRAIEALRERRKRPRRRGQYAIKRIRTYFAAKPRTAKKSSSLKLKLKLTSKAHFEVVPAKVLVGPYNEVCLVNGGVIPDPVKTERDVEDEVEWGKSAGEAGRAAEAGEEPGKTLDEAGEGRPKKGAAKADDDKGHRGNACEEVVLKDEGFENEAFENDDLITIEKTELPTPCATPCPTPCPTPTPFRSASPVGSPAKDGEGEDDDEEEAGKNRRPGEGDEGGGELEEEEEDDADFSEGDDFSQSPTMVEMNGSTVGDVRSPLFPSTSPAPPAGQTTPPAPARDQLEDEGNSEGQQVLPDAEQVECDSGRGSGSSFAWNDVGDGADGVPAIEEDPLLLPGGSDAATGAGVAAGDAQGDVAPVEEFISYDRLGENAVFCDVCGERTADQAALDNHRLHVGHFKCPQPACVGMLFANPDELLTHAQNAHGTQQQHRTPPPVQQHHTPPPQQQQQQQYSMGQPQGGVMEQSAPVQQLVQQVQRLPVAQAPMQGLNWAPPHSTALAPQQQQQQQAQYHPRPPPLHPAPAPIRQQYAQAAPPPYPAAPQVIYPPQPYPGQAYIPNTRQPMQAQGRPYMIPSGMPQQMRHVPPPRMQGPPMQRGMLVQQQQQQVVQGNVGPAKRVAPPSAPQQPKHRRTDLLIPDARHDDADCHVIAMQKRGGDSGFSINSVQSQSPSSSRDSTISLSESITLSVRGQQNQQAPAPRPPRSDANTVANLLATRGITVTPAGGAGRSGGQGPAPSQQQLQQHRQVNRQPAAPAQPQQGQPVTTLNLSSAISIIPTQGARQSKHPQQQGNFAVPQGRSAARPQTQAQVERPPRPPTVDLTGDAPTPPSLQPMMGRGRGRGRGPLSRHMCNICDKAFNTPDALNQHMQVHRSPGKLPFRCTLCSAQYPNQQGLLQHRQTFHKEAVQATELVIPVVDLKNPTTVGRLSSLGVRHFVPLSQLANQAGGNFGLPLLSIEGGRFPNAGLSALTSSRFLSFGPLRQLPQ